MLFAMISVLTLLPKLLLIYKPFGKEAEKLNTMSNFFESFINKINLFDVFVLIIFIYCIVQCFVKGFSLSLISFMKWVISTIVTIILSSKTST